MNFANDFFDSIQSNKCLEAIAIIDNEITVTYQELQHQIFAKIQTMQEMAMQPDDGVIFMRPDSCQWLIDFFAAIYLGGRIILLPWNCTRSRLCHTISVARAKWISCEDNIGPDFTHGLSMIGESATTSEQTIDPVVMDNNHPSLWLFSSGTSGSMPKAVVHRHGSMIQAVEILKETYGAHPGKVVFSTSKLSFQYGLFSALYGLFSGYKIILTNRVPSSDLITSITRSNQVTHLFSTPRVLSSLRKSTADPSALSTVETLVSAGEHLPHDLESSFVEKYAKQILNAIGMSEMIICMIGNTPDDYVFGTLGKPFNRVKIKVVDDFENEVGINEIGELMIKSPTCALGYFDDLETTAKAFNDGWYKTNDLVQKLEEGRIRYVGRKNDCDKINGLFVSPVDIENVISNYHAVDECMVAIVTGPQQRKILIANLVLTDPAKKFAAGDLRRFLLNHLEPHMIPKIIKIVDEIPTTFTTKKMRSRIIIDHKDLAFI